MRTKFQRRHYSDIAAVIARARARAKFNDCAVEVVGDLEQDLIDLFRADNPKFKPSRFIAAANVEAKP